MVALAGEVREAGVFVEPGETGGTVEPEGEAVGCRAAVAVGKVTWSAALEQPQAQSETTMSNAEPTRVLMAHSHPIRSGYANDLAAEPRMD